MNIQYKHARRAITPSKSAASGTRTVSGWITTFGPPADYTGDIVAETAVDRHLAEHGYRLPMLSGHDVHEMIGWHQLKKVPGQGVWTDTTFLEGIQRADEDLKRVQSGAMAFSIGFISRKDEYRNGIRWLLDIELLEASIVLLPANPLATIEQRQGTHADQALKELLQPLRDMTDELALKNALRQLAKTMQITR